MSAFDPISIESRAPNSASHPGSALIMPNPEKILVS
jgi:hypothetical protein